MKRTDDSPDPIGTTPKRLADELTAVGLLLARTAVRTRALQIFLPCSGVLELCESIRTAADAAVDLASKVLVGRVDVDAKLVDRSAGRGDRPLIDRIAAVHQEEAAKGNRPLGQKPNETAPTDRRFEPPPDLPPGHPDVGSAGRGLAALAADGHPAVVEPRNGFVELPAEPKRDWTVLSNMSAAEREYFGVRPADPGPVPAPTERVAGTLPTASAKRKPACYSWEVFATDPTTGGFVPLDGISVPTRDPEKAQEYARQGCAGNMMMCSDGRVRDVEPSRVVVFRSGSPEAVRAASRPPPAVDPAPVGDTFQTLADLHTDDEAGGLPAPAGPAGELEPEEPDDGADEGFGINPGDLVFTSYNSGPYLVKIVSRSRRGFDLACVRITDPNDIDAAHRKRADSWINDCRREGDRFPTGKRNPDNAAIPGQPEVFLISPEQLAAKFEEIQQWRIGGPAPAKPFEPLAADAAERETDPSTTAGKCRKCSAAVPDGYWLCDGCRDPLRSGPAVIEPESATDAAKERNRRRRETYAKAKRDKDIARAIGNPVEAAGGPVGSIAREPVGAGPTEPVERLAPTVAPTVAEAVSGHKERLAAAMKEASVSTEPADDIFIAWSGRNPLYGIRAKSLMDAVVWVRANHPHDAKISVKVDEGIFAARKLMLQADLKKPTEPAGDPGGDALRAAAQTRRDAKRTARTKHCEDCGATLPDGDPGAKCSKCGGRVWGVYDAENRLPVEEQTRIGTVKGANITRAVLAAEAAWPNIPKARLHIVECYPATLRPISARPANRLQPAEPDRDLADARAAWDADGEAAADPAGNGRRKKTADV